MKDSPLFACACAFACACKCKCWCACACSVGVFSVGVSVVPWDVEHLSNKQAVIRTRGWDCPLLTFTFPGSHFTKPMPDTTWSPVCKDNNALEPVKDLTWTREREKVRRQTRRAFFSLPLLGFLELHIVRLAQTDGKQLPSPHASDTYLMLSAASCWRACHRLSGCAESRDSCETISQES